jgi:hypothetical protein
VEAARAAGGAEGQVLDIRRQGHLGAGELAGDAQRRAAVAIIDPADRAVINRPARRRDRHQPDVIDGHGAGDDLEAELDALAPEISNVDGDGLPAGREVDRDGGHRGVAGTGEDAEPGLPGRGRLLEPDRGLLGCGIDGEGAALEQAFDSGVGVGPVELARDLVVGHEAGEEHLLGDPVDADRAAAALEAELDRLPFPVPDPDLDRRPPIAAGALKRLDQGGVAVGGTRVHVDVHRVAPVRIEGAEVEGDRLGIALDREGIGGQGGAAGELRPLILGTAAGLDAEA